MERTSRMDKTENLTSDFATKKFKIIALLIGVVYLVLRLSFPDTIEFGYDQPRLAYTVLDFINNGNLLNSQNYSLATSWGNLSWGPLLVIFNAIFLKITTDPFYVSILMMIFNLLSVVFVVLIGKEFISKRIALLAGLILATHPWWIIFSRMIYQPTPIPTFIAISTYFLFKTIKNPKSKWIIPLVFSWVVLIQSYLITIAFIFLSFAILLYESRLKINYKYLMVSIVIAIVAFIPSVKYYYDNPSMFYTFLTFKGKYITSYGDTFIGFIKTLSGNNFEWQLGYAYEVFNTKSWYFELYRYVNTIVISILLLAGFLISYFKKNKYTFYVSILLMSPLVALPLIGVEYVVPRYFLYVLPFLSLTVAISIDYFFDKLGKVVLLIPTTIVALWMIYIFSYFNFIKSYDYPRGFISNWSDVPHIYLKNSFDWIESDSKIKKYDSYTVSLNPERPTEFDFNYAQRYYWEYVLDKDEKLTGNVGHYLMYFTPAKNGYYQRFGPYVVYDNSTNVGY